MSVLDRINLTFVYDEIGQTGRSTEEQENEVTNQKEPTGKLFGIFRFTPDGNSLQCCPRIRCVLVSVEI